MYYDLTVPFEKEDIRLPLNAWRTAGEWADARVNREPGKDSVALSADRLAFTFVGSYGRVTIVTISQAELDARLRSLGPRPDVPALLIVDLANHPSVLNETVQFENLVYSNSLVVFIVTVPITKAQ